MIMIRAWITPSSRCIDPVSILIADLLLMLVSATPGAPLRYAMHSSGHIPIEVLEAIIDQARDSRELLRSLSLVSPVLVPRVRCHIFSHLIIHSKEQLESVPDFVQARPWLPPLVRRLTICGPRLHNLTPVRILTMFPNLRNLGFTWGYPRGGEYERDFGRHVFEYRFRFLTVLRQLSTHVRRLELRGHLISSLDDLSVLLHAFPCLDSLLCISIRIMKPRARRAHTHFPGGQAVPLTTLIVGS